MNNQPQQEQKVLTFDNNPFSLAFNAMSRAFKINQTPAIIIIVGGIVLWIANQIGSNIPDIMNTIARGSGKETEAIVALIAAALSLVILFVSVAISTLWNSFTAFVGTKNARGESTTFSAGLQSAFATFWKVLGINFMIGLYAMLCFLPAILFFSVSIVVKQWVVYLPAVIAACVGFFFALRISLARTLSIYAVHDEGLGVFAAMSRSVSLTKGRLVEVWGIFFVGSIVPIIGPLLSVCGMGAHFLQLKVYRDHNAELPKVHFLSWLGLSILGLFLLLILSVLLLFIMLANSK